MKPIYLDHQATTPTTPSVYEAMKPYWSEKFGNPHSSEHLIGMIASGKIEESKQKIAQLIKCEPDEIFFTSGATESNNSAIFALCSLSKSASAKQVIISAIEHKCVIEAAKYWTEVFNLDLKILPVDNEGYVYLSDLKKLLRTPTLFCSIILANNEIGTLQKLDKIADLTRESGTILHSDCAQVLLSGSHYKICEMTDVASFSGHKIGGPQGIGCMYISAILQNNFRPLILGGGQQNGIRSGTLPLPLCVGLGQAFENVANIDFNHVRAQRDIMFTTLKQLIPHITLNGPKLTERHACNLNIYFPGVLSNDLIASLKPRIAMSTGSACGSGNIEQSYVLSAISKIKDVSRNSIRMSVCEHTTKGDIQNGARHIADAYYSLIP